MDQIQSLISWIKNIGTENLMDIIIALIVIMGFNLFSSLLAFIVIKLFSFKEKDGKKLRKKPIFGTLKRAFSLLGVFIGLNMLNLPKSIMQELNQILKIFAIILMGNGVASIFTPGSRMFKNLLKAIKLNLDKATAGFVSKIIKSIIYVITAFIVLVEMNIDVSGLVAGLGISSVIIALAAQDLAQNLFGGFAVLLDKPFKIGDWIEVGTYSGTVEDITFRSTRLRTMDNTLVTIQNSTISSESIINWARLESRRYVFNLNLALETPAEAVERVVHKINFMLSVNPDILEDTIHVNFEKILDESLSILIYFYTTVTAYEEFLKFKNDTNIAVLRVLDSEKVALSYPGRNIYLKEPKTFSNDEVNEEVLNEIRKISKENDEEKNEEEKIENKIKSRTKTKTKKDKN